MDVPEFDPSRGPRFHDMPSGAFERLSVELASHQFDGVVHADTFQKSGIAQFGVDFIVDRGDLGIVVGSCRADGNPAKNRLVGAAQEFAENWDDKWKERNVTKFILCSGATTTTELRLAHIREAQKIIEELGIEFEAWFPPKFVQLLAQERAIVRRYFRHWEGILCDQPTVFDRDSQGPRTQNLAAQIQSIEDDLVETRSSLDTQVQRRIDAAEQERNEVVFDAMRRVATEFVTNSQAWNQLSKSTQARLLRAEAIGLLNDGQADRAKEVFEESQAIDAPVDRYFEAAIRHRRDGAQAALDLLKTPDTLRECGLKAAIALSIGRLDTTEELVGENLTDSELYRSGKPDEQAELLRIRVLLRLAEGRAEDALSAATEASRLAPENWHVRLANAASLYASTLVPGTRVTSISWPEPTPRLLVRTNPNSQAARNEASIVFAALQADSGQEYYNDLLVWRYACACDDQARKAEADELLTRHLDHDVIHPGMVLWALTRHAIFDRDNVKKKLEAQIPSHSNAVECAIAAAWIAAELDGPEKALALLETHQSLFDDDQGRRLYHIWRAQFGEQPEAGSAEEEILLQTELSKAAEIQQSFVDQDRSKLAATFQDTDISPSLRVEAAKALATLGEWQPLWEEREYLAKEIATHDSVELAACAAANVGPADSAHEFILETARTALGDLNDQIRPPYAHALARASRINDALQVAGALRTGVGGTRFSVMAEVYRLVGDLRGAAANVKEAVLAKEQLWYDPVSLFRWSKLLAEEDRPLAAKLLRRLRKTGYSGLEVPVGFLALSLLPNDNSDFVASLHEAAQSGAPGIAIMSHDAARTAIAASQKEASERQDFYLSAKVPVHLIYAQQLGLIRILPFERPGSIAVSRAMLANAVPHSGDLNDIKRIVLDITALLTIETLELWDVIDALPFELALPHSLPSALHEIENATRPLQP